MQQDMSLQNIIEQVSKEKGIDPAVLVETMEQAILTAAKRTFGMTRELEARFSDETGNVDLYQFMTVVEELEDPEREVSIEDARRYGFEDAQVGEDLGFQIFYLPEDSEEAKKQDRQYGDLLKLQQHRRGFGRIAAQTAKQVIIQRVRDAERELIFNEYKDRKGELITGIVRRFERGSNIIVDLGRTEAILPTREQTPRESYRPGDRIVAYLKDIDREARGPQIILSRTDVGLLVKLFEMEVPEIYEGIVRIVAAAREPGARSKIAVTSKDSDVDPVGACVGMKGSRVQAVVQELRGEKIDIVPWDRDPARFVCNAIAPAEVSRVVIDEGHGGMELVVPDAKLSLAIGRRGQNVRLASQLTGWKLDIVSEARFRQMEEQAIAELGRIASADEDMVKSFYRMGFRSLDEVAEALDDELMTIDGIGSAEDAAKIRTQAATAMEAHRAERVESAKAQPEALTEREHLLLARGLTERIVEALEHSGYRSVQDVLRETDVDRLAIRTGLGTHKAHEVKKGVAQYVEEEMEAVKEAQRVARAEAEAVAEAEAEAAAEAAAAAEPEGEAAEAPAAFTETKEVGSAHADEDEDQVSMVVIENEGRTTPERTCAGCRRSDAREALLRFAVCVRAGEAGEPQLLADPRRRLPGRGVSVHPSRECVRRAVERGGFARALGAKLTIGADALCEQAAAQYARRLDGLLLAARRSGALLVGTDVVRRALAEGSVALLLVAEDAAGRREEVLEQAARLGGRCAVYGSKEALGRLMGRAEVGVMAVLEAGLAEEVAATAARATELAGRGVAPGRVSEAE